MTHGFYDCFNFLCKKWKQSYHCFYSVIQKPCSGETDGAIYYTNLTHKTPVNSKIHFSALTWGGLTINKTLSTTHKHLSGSWVAVVARTPPVVALILQRERRTRRRARITPLDAGQARSGCRRVGGGESASERN